MASRRFVTGGLLLLLASMGCSTIQLECQEFCATKYNECEAIRAWRQHRPHYKNSTCSPRDFGYGFRQGYMAVANGGTGCPPTLPPQKYWGVCYQNDAGQQKICAWYDGYSSGVMAAETRCIRGRNQIPTSGHFQAQHAAADMHPHAMNENDLPPPPESLALPPTPPVGPADHAPLAPPGDLPGAKPAPAMAPMPMPMTAPAAPPVELAPVPQAEAPPLMLKISG